MRSNEDVGVAMSQLEKLEARYASMLETMRILTLRLSVLSEGAVLADRALRRARERKAASACWREGARGC